MLAAQVAESAHATAAPDDAASLVNLARYPVADLGSPAAQAVIAEGRAQLARDGLCLLPDFLAPAALQAMADEARALEPGAYYKANFMTTYGGDGVKPAPLPRPSRNACAAISYDRIAADSPSRRLYEWDGLVALFRALLGIDALYRCADPYISCLLMYYADGDELGWHFDPNDGVVTLLLQKASEGGDFEFAPRTGRNQAGPGGTVERIMHGSREGVVAPQLQPGTLSLFRGLNALHRVTPVSGPVSRIMLTMSFNPTPGHQFTASNRKRYTGYDT